MTFVGATTYRASDLLDCAAPAPGQSDPELEQRVLPHRPQPGQRPDSIHGKHRLRPPGVVAEVARRRIVMLNYAIIFLVIALVAGVLGFGGIAGSAVGIAKILFLVFIVLFLASLIMGRRSRG
jgi:uncharacterized membrane protein YtjA (UPF0391 family)